MNEMYNMGIEELLSNMNSVKRKTKGQNRSTKSYHKITISVTKQEKEDISKMAEKRGISVSRLIKDLFREEGMFNETY